MKTSQTKTKQEEQDKVISATASEIAKLVEIEKKARTTEQLEELKDRLWEYVLPDLLRVLEKQGKEIGLFLNAARPAPEYDDSDLSEESKKAIDFLVKECWQHLSCYRASFSRRAIDKILCELLPEKEKEDAADDYEQETYDGLMEAVSDMELAEIRTLTENIKNNGEALRKVWMTKNRRTHNSFDKLPAALRDTLTRMLVDDFWPDDYPVPHKGKPRYEDLVIYCEAKGYKVSRSTVGRFGIQARTLESIKSNGKVLAQTA